MCSLNLAEHVNASRFMLCFLVSTETQLIFFFLHSV